MTIEQAAVIVERLVGPIKFNLEVGNYYNPRKTRYCIFTDYRRHECSMGTGSSWEEAIEDLKKGLKDD